jgi:SNF2 family DNA or RNA helicase
VYAYKGNQPYTLGWRNEEQFYERFWWLAKHEDRGVLDLPEATTVFRTFNLTGKGFKIYSELRDDFVTKIEDETLEYVNAAVLVSKLQQIAAGTVLVEGVHTHVHNQKLSVLKEVMSECRDEPFVIFCRYRADITNVKLQCHHDRISVAELSGEMNQLEEWQNGDYEALVVQVQSGSEGIDLTRAAVAIFFTVGYGLSEIDQAHARIHRPGQDKNVTFVHILAENTVDKAIYRAIEGKRDIVDAVVNAGKMGER